MRSIVRVGIIGLGAVASTVLLLADPAGAGSPDLSGCHGQATSLNGDGEVIEEASGEPPHDVVGTDGEPIFTSDNPFPIASDGEIAWSGESTSLIVDGTWTAKVWGYTVDDGVALNRERATQREDTYTIDGVLPLDARGLALVEVVFEGEGGTCRGTGFVKVDGSPTFTPPWLAGAGLTLAGLGVLFFAQPKQVWRRG